MKLEHQFKLLVGGYYGITYLDVNGILRINEEKLEEFRGGFLDGENN